MKTINLKNKVLFTIVVAMVGVAVISCKDDNDADNKSVKVSNVYNSGCMGSAYSPAQNSKDGESEESFNVYNDGKTVFISHNNRVVFCGYDSISVSINVANDTIWVKEIEMGGVTNCMCLANTSYQINNLPSGQYTLLIRLCENDYYNPEVCGPVKYQTTVNL
ncbi:MAG: hypothetical protein J6V54_01185 [Bacteroidales bacterium]|nr:hypothetical protein [Bacteroidales bacterium]